MRYGILIKIVVCHLIVCWASVGVSAGQVKEDTSGTTEYDQLFSGKPAKVSEGMITLRKMGGKVYFEFPTRLLHKKMLLGASVEATSNAADAAAGEQPDYPLSVYFTQEDSTIHMRGVRVWAVTSDSTRKIQAALDKSSLGPILDSFEIEAVTPDSSAVVFDATGIFVTDREATDPFGPFGGVSSLFSSREPSFNKNRSHLADIQAYEDNITVTSYLSYEVSSSFLGFQTEKERPATYLMRHTLVLLPEETMRPRIADPRIGVSSNEYRKVLGHNGT